MAEKKFIKYNGIDQIIVREFSYKGAKKVELHNPLNNSKIIVDAIKLNTDVSTNTKGR